MKVLLSMSTMSESFQQKAHEYTATNGVYVSMTPVSGARKVFNVVKESLAKVGIQPKPIDYYHVTIVWSEKSPSKDIVKLLVQDSRTCKARVKGVVSWEGHDKDGYVVLELDSDDLKRRHAEWLKAGASHSFQDYRAHVTLASGLNLETAKPAVDELNAYFKKHPTLLVFGEELAADRKD